MLRTLRERAVKIDIARCIYRQVLLTYPEKEVWKMTLGKIIVLYREWKKDHGIKDVNITLDDVIPL